MDIPAAATWARLHTFLSVYETGSVRAAAEALHVTPPAVSAAITALETAFGTTLFVKAGRGIVPSDSADVLAGYARRLVGLLTEASGAVHEAERGQVRIGAVATASEYVLPPLIAAFAHDYPQVQLSLTVLPRDELFALAADHALDVVLAGRPPRGAGLVTRASRANRLIVVAAPGMQTDPLTARWLLTGVGSGTRGTTLALLEQLQAAPPLLTLGTVGAVVAAATHGLGVALVHEAAVRAHLDAGSLVALPVAHTPLSRPWHLCTAAEPTAATRLFVDQLCDERRVGTAALRPVVPGRRG